MVRHEVKEAPVEVPHALTPILEAQLRARYPGELPACSRCRHCYRVTDSPQPLECRQSPPLVLAVPVQHPITGQRSMQTAILARTVLPDYFCGAFEPDVLGLPGVM